MMPEMIWFDAAHLSDAGRLRSSGNPLAELRNLAEIRQAIRNLQELCAGQVWLAGVEEQVRDRPEDRPEDRHGRVQAVVGFQLIDPLARRAVLHLYADCDKLRPDILAAILRKSFRELNLYRLELAVPAESTAWLPILQAAGMIEEGCLRACRYDSMTKRHQDVLLYSILRPESRLLSTAFVPFRLGVFAITGDEEMLLTTGFIRHCDFPESPVLQESAEMLGLLGSQGDLLPYRELEERLGGNPFWIHPNASAIVRKAAGQIAEYFTGRRTSFDLPIVLTSGSTFQQKVWLALADIPCGATWTYEELAHHLDYADWSAARKMARAVGSACGANPLPLLLPCHRVIGKDGRLVGFAGGLDIKEYLLAHELMGVNEEARLPLVRADVLARPDINEKME